MEKRDDKKVYAFSKYNHGSAFILTACTPAATPAPAAEAPAVEAPAVQVPATEAPAVVAPTAEAPAAPAAEAVNITLWTKEGEADGGLQYVQALADAYTKENPNVTFEVINKEVEILREDFQTSSLANAAPDLLLDGERPCRSIPGCRSYPTG